MSDLVCTKCSIKATYNQADCWDSGHTEDGEPIEQECDHNFVEPEKSNAFGVRAKNVETGEYKVLKTFFDFQHTEAENFARKLRKKFDQQPLKFEVASGFHKCWSCGEDSTDQDFLVVNNEGNRVCRDCANAPEVPFDQRSEVMQ